MKDIGTGTDTDKDIYTEQAQPLKLARVEAGS